MNTTCITIKLLNNISYKIINSVNLKESYFGVHGFHKMND